MTSRRLDGRVALITGAGAGIGAATASRLAAEGAAVVVTDINVDSAQRQTEMIRSAGGRAVALLVDIGDFDSLERAVATAVEQFGRLDVLHNNAVAASVAGRETAIAKADPQVWDEMFHVTVTGTMVATKLALGHMLVAGSGSIINTSSIGGRVGLTHNPAYSAAKAAIEALTRNTATTYGKQGIRCNAVCPALTITENLAQYFTAEVREGALRHYPSPRLGEPNDLAAAVAFLASDDAAFINGQTIVVDGGLTMHTPTYADELAQL